MPPLATPPHVLCMEELRMSIIAIGSVFPGFIPFALNLSKSEDVDVLPVSPWASEYSRGAAHELYVLPMPASRGVSYRALRDRLYAADGVLLLGLAVRSNNGGGVAFNPASLDEVRPGTGLWLVGIDRVTAAAALVRAAVSWLAVVDAPRQSSVPPTFAPLP